MIRSSENALSVSKDKTESGYICQNFVGTQHCCVLILYPIAPPDPRFLIAKFCCFYAGLPIYGNGKQVVFPIYGNGVRETSAIYRNGNE